MNTLLKVDLVTLNNAGITPNEYLFLIQQKVPEFALESGELPVNLVKLENLGLIKILEEGVALRQKALKVIPIGALELTNVENWIEEWRELWPTGVRTNSRPVKASRAACLLKMKKFLKKNDYAKEDILEVTKIYIDNMSVRRFDKMTCADYFIEKDSVSLLAALLEDAIDGEERNQDTSFFQEV